MVKDFIGLYREALTTLAAILTIVLLIGAFCLGLGLLLNHSDHVDCLRLHEQTGLETRYARSGLNGECYVNVNGGMWVPQSTWRNFN